MSTDAILPPKLPEDCTKSALPPSDNVVETAETKLIFSTVHDGAIENFSLEGDMSVFFALAIGITARAHKASVLTTAANVAGDNSVYNFPLAETEAAAQMMLARYLYEIYSLIVTGHTSIPYVPRNICFLLNAMARNRVAMIRGISTLVVLNNTSGRPLLDEEREKCSTFLRLSQLAYDVVNTVVEESGPIVSSPNEDMEKPVTHNKINLNALGSTYTSFQPYGTAYVLSDYYLEQVSPATWWIKAALSMPLGTVMDGTSITSSWYGISVHPWSLATFTAYADTVCDVPYVMSVTYPLEVTIDPTTHNLSYWSTYSQSLYDMLIQLDVVIPPSLNDVHFFALMMRNLYMLAGCMYSPFGLLYSEFYIATGIQDPDADNNYSMRMSYVCTKMEPYYMPSLLHECVSSLGETIVIKTTNLGLTKNIQVFNIPFWPAYKAAVNEFVYYTLQDIKTMVLASLDLLTMRRFLKLNMVPEFKVNRALIPMFFFHAPVVRDVAPHPGAASLPTPFTACLTFYNMKYVQDHNLHALARPLLWPKAFQINTAQMHWFGIVELVPDIPTLTDVPEFDPITSGFLSLDASYQADGCEIDAYLYKMRTNHLGFFAALAGLLPTALKVGTSLFQAIVKPSKNTDVGENTSLGSSITTSQTNNMAQAGVSSLTQTVAGPPGSGGSVDLHGQVQVDPVSFIESQGKKYFPRGKLSKILKVGTKAIRIARDTYTHYKDNK